MLEQQQQQVTETLRRIIAELGFEAIPVQWRTIPFKGEWGLGTPIAFQLANQELAGRDDLDKKSRAKAAKDRAPEIADEIAARLREHHAAGRVEAQGAYVNLYFDVPAVTAELIDHVLAAGSGYGRGAEKPQRVMIEYSQPNTHKIFHVGHLRNVCLGHSLGRILGFAGFDTIQANYIGDIGMHVIRCLWCYLSFHRGGEPAEGRGKWLGQVYVEAGQRLDLREHAVGLLRDLAAEPAARERLHRWADGLDESSKHRLLYAIDPAWQRAADDGSKGVAPEEAADAVREHVPGLWREVGAWVGEEGRSELAHGYRVLDRRMAWWPQVDAWRDEVKDLFRRWDLQEPEVVALWERTKAWSMEEFLEIYRFLGAEFDVWFYESEVEEEGKRIVDEMIAKGIAEDHRPDGPVLVHIDDLLGAGRGPERGQTRAGDFRTLIILRGDGTSLYSTKDLALARRKFRDFGVDTAIYVVDIRQAFYFKQIFKTLELWGFPQAENCYHLAYEIVTDPSGAMASRAGRVIPFEDFAATALAKALATVEAKNPHLSAEEKQEIARVVAIGAIRYSMLSADDNKVITFDLDQALAFEGRSAPYIQYAHARACRILEKAGADAGAAALYGHLATTGGNPKVEIDLIEKIAEFPHVVSRAAEGYKPHLVAAYLFELATAWSDFYQQCDVLRGDLGAGVRAARLRLVRAARQTLKNGLWLIGIEAPEVM